jgi:hypothetical protein
MRLGLSILVGATAALPNLLGFQAVSPTAKAVFAAIPQGQLRQGWRVGTVTVEENILGVWTSLAVQNMSTQSMRRARFYVEYFGPQDRQCFSAAFDIKSNAGGRATPIQPLENRELLSMSYGLGFAVTPVSAKVFLVDEEDTNGATLSDHTEFTIPITMSGGGPDSWQHLQPSPRAKMPIQAASQDLILARVTVGPEGKAIDNTVIDAADEQLRGWFSDVIRSVPFVPGARGAVARASTTLVLVRLVNLDRKAEIGVASNSPWLHEWASSTSESTIPVVIQVLFAPPGQFGSPRSPMLGEPFENSGVGSGWSSNVYLWLGPNQHGWRLDSPSPR